MDAKLQELCRQAHEDRIRVGMLDTDTKNRTLELAADALMAHEQEILEANAIDMERGRERNMPQGLLDRLKLIMTVFLEWQTDSGRWRNWKIPSGK